MIISHLALEKHIKLGFVAGSTELVLKTDDDFEVLTFEIWIS